MTQFICGIVDSELWYIPIAWIQELVQIILNECYLTFWGCEYYTFGLYSLRFFNDGGFFAKGTVNCVFEVEGHTEIGPRYLIYFKGNW